MSLSLWREGGGWWEVWCGVVSEQVSCCCFWREREEWYSDPHAASAWFTHVNSNRKRVFEMNINMLFTVLFVYLT